MSCKFQSFINVEDIGPLDKAMAEAFEIKNDRFKYQHLGKKRPFQVSAPGQEQDPDDDIL